MLFRLPHHLKIERHQDHVIAVIFDFIEQILAPAAQRGEFEAADLGQFLFVTEQLGVLPVDLVASPVLHRNDGQGGT